MTEGVHGIRSPGDIDDRDPRFDVACSPAHGNAVQLTWHVDVRHDGGEFVPRVDNADCFVACFSFHYAMAALNQAFCKDQTNQEFVLDQQDVWVLHS